MELPELTRRARHPREVKVDDSGLKTSSFARPLGQPSPDCPSDCARRSAGLTCRVAERHGCRFLESRRIVGGLNPTGADEPSGPPATRLGTADQSFRNSSLTPKVKKVPIPKFSSSS